MPETPSYGSASFSDFQSPPRNGPLGSGPIGSLNELYSTPVVSFNLDRNLVKFCGQSTFTSIFLSFSTVAT
jgi:hypothetical protein